MSNRYLTFIFACFLWIPTLTAQYEFAPIGATWVYNVPLKSFYLESVDYWIDPSAEFYAYEYIEKIGSSRTHGKGLMYGAVVPEFIPEWLRCYHDSTTNYQSPKYLFYNKPDCYYRPPSAVGEDFPFKISVSPNPFVDYFTIQSPEFPVESVALYNTLGQRVWHLNMPKNPQQDITITANHLAPGLYYCWLQSGPQTRVVKLVKE